MSFSEYDLYKWLTVQIVLKIMRKKITLLKFVLLFIFW